jgi:hypothetical protein
MYNRSRDSSVGVAMGLSWMAGVRFLAGARHFSLLHRVQTGSGPIRPPIQKIWGGGGFFPGVKPPSAEVKNGVPIPPPPHMS